MIPKSDNGAFFYRLTMSIFLPTFRAVESLTSLHSAHFGSSSAFISSFMDEAHERLTAIFARPLQKSVYREDGRGAPEVEQVIEQ